MIAAAGTYLCVYCGAHSGVGNRYLSAVYDLAAALASKGFGLVYGGASVGLMGILADAMLSLGVNVVGVIPDYLVEEEKAHTGLSTLHVVPSMRERKELMERLSDGFIVLPGGLGTLDEFMELLTLRQIGIVTKPVGLLNVDHYYDGLLSFIEFARSRGFVTLPMDQLMVTDDQPDGLVDSMVALLFPDPPPPTGRARGSG